ncbi:MAG: glycosyltransferase family 2 protein [Bacteroidota bacterium]
MLKDEHKMDDSPKEPLVSIITSFLNEEQLIEETIQTVLAQTYANWEYILIDDGSTDSSTQIAKAYAEKYPGKIIYYEHENHKNIGVSPSRNVGVRLATGEYIALLDGDDLWLPEKLERQVELALEFPLVDFFCEGSYYMNKGRDPNQVNVDVLVGTKQNTLYQPPSLFFTLHPLSKGSAPCVSSLFGKTHFVRSFNGFEETFTGKNFLYEDQAFLSKIYFHGTVYVSSLCNNIYRQRSDSAMHIFLAKGTDNNVRKFYLKWLKKYLQEQHVQYPSLNALLRKNWLMTFYPRVYKYTFGLYNKFRSAIRR